MPLSLSQPLHKVIIQNIEGLIPFRHRKKVKLLSEIAQEKSALILALTESHLTENIHDAEINMENYTLFRTDRTSNRKKGGVITYIHNHVAALSEILISTSNSYTEAHAIFIKGIDTILINIYRPPACPTNKFLEPISQIKNILQNLQGPMPTILLTGDLNFPMINWVTESVYGGTEEVRVQAKALLHFAEELCLTQIISSPTRKSNILDIVMTNNDELVHEYCVDETNLSDHNIITLTTNIRSDPHQAICNLTQRLPPTIINLSNLNFFSETVHWENLRSQINSVDWPELLRDFDPDDQYKLILWKCLHIAKQHVPLKRPPTPRTSIPRDRKILMRKRTKLRRKLRLSPNTVTNQLIARKISLIDDSLKLSVEREAERQEELAISRIKTNTKYFYKYAASKSKVKASIGPLKVSQDHIARNPEEIARVLRMQYEQTFSVPYQEKIIHSSKEFFHPDDWHTTNLTDINFTQTDIQNAIKQIANNAAAGPDQFPAILLKNCAKELSVPLSIFYRKSLDTGIIPKLLKTAKITPVFKGGSRAEAQNYRPIALTSHIIKVLEKLLVKEISSYLEGHDKLNQDQYGFRAGRSCLAQLLAHQEKILTALENNTSVDVIYLDFAKAYDKVDHGILLHKVRQMGIQGKIGVWLHTYLTNRKQVVAVDGIESEPSIVTSGVPQGSSLGPLLFLVHISDINEQVKFSTVASFADDTRILRPVSTELEANQLQEDLSTLYSWAEINNMSFNNNKFEYIAYNPIPNTITTRLYTAPDGTNIEMKDSVRDLGITLTCDGYFTLHIANIVKKARNQVGWILRSFKTRDHLPMLTLYKSLVLPHLEYCCQLWSPWRAGDKQSLEAIQRSYTNKISSVCHLDYWGRLEALKLFSLERRRERYAIIYIYKILIGITTNNINIRTTTHQRLGRYCIIDRIHPRASTRVTTLKQNSFATRGPQLFNALPRHIRDITDLSLDQFKTKLDSFLWTVPDQPKLPHYHARAVSNSIIDQLAQQRADGNY